MNNRSITAVLLQLVIQFKLDSLEHTLFYILFNSSAILRLKLSPRQIHKNFQKIQIITIKLLLTNIRKYKQQYKLALNTVSIQCRSLVFCFLFSVHHIKYTCSIGLVVFFSNYALLRLFIRGTFYKSLPRLCRSAANQAEEMIQRKNYL